MTRDSIQFRRFSPDNPDNQKFVDFARQVLGSLVQINDHSRDFGRPSIVWQLVASDGSRLWLKHHETSRQFQRELMGLENYIPALGVQTWWSSPTLVAKDCETSVIVMTEVKGDTLGSSPTSTDEELTMFRLAGRFIRKLHDLENFESNQKTAQIDFRNRSEHYLSAGEASVDTETMHWARALVDQATNAGNLKPVPCHRDFSPRNWLIERSQSGIKFGVIDWERTGPDIWLQDMQRMVYDHWHGRPQLREAYFEGYGREPTESELLQLDVICLVGAIASISWANTHNDVNFANISRAVIERIRAQRPI